MKMARILRVLALVIVAQWLGYSTARAQQISLCYVDGTISCLDAVLYEGIQNGWDLSCGPCNPIPTGDPNIKFCSGWGDTVHIANASVNIEYAAAYPEDPFGNTQGRVSTTTGATKVCGVIVECALNCTNNECEFEEDALDLNIARRYATGSICYTDIAM
jgi:hypothetical protein